MTEENEGEKELETKRISSEDSWFDVQAKAVKLWADRGELLEWILASVVSVSHREEGK